MVLVKTETGIGTLENSSVIVRIGQQIHWRSIVWNARNATDLYTKHKCSRGTQTRSNLDIHIQDVQREERGDGSIDSMAVEAGGSLDPQLPWKKWADETALPVTPVLEGWDQD